MNLLFAIRDIQLRTGRDLAQHFFGYSGGKCTDRTICDVGIYAAGVQRQRISMFLMRGQAIFTKKTVRL